LDTPGVFPRQNVHGESREIGTSRKDEGRKEQGMRYTAPIVTDFGSIAAHTFERAQIPPNICEPKHDRSNKQGDTRVCELDDFCEYSCS
jgi:hypothetical protein